MARQVLIPPPSFDFQFQGRWHFCDLHWHQRPFSRYLHITSSQCKWSYFVFVTWKIVWQSKPHFQGLAHCCLWRRPGSRVLFASERRVSVHQVIETQHGTLSLGKQKLSGWQYAPCVQLFQAVGLM